MTLTCSSCKQPFEAKRSYAKYCGDTCRKRAQRVPRLTGPAPSEGPANSLAAVTERALLDAGVLDTIAGQQAMVLARRIGSPAETGAAVASMSKQLQVVVAEALRSVQAVDPLDQLRARRDAKRLTAG